MSELTADEIELRLSPISDDVQMELDDLVHDLHDALASEAFNAQEDGDDADPYELYSHKASEVNNQGPHAQIQCLLDGGAPAEDILDLYRLAASDTHRP